MLPGMVAGLVLLEHLMSRQHKRSSKAARAAERRRVAKRKKQVRSALIAVGVVVVLVAGWFALRPGPAPTAEAETW